MAAVWRGPLLANGGLVDLPRALRDPLAVCDLLFTQVRGWTISHKQTCCMYPHVGMDGMLGPC